MSHALAGSCNGFALKNRNAFKQQRPVRLTRTVVRSHLSPARASEQARENIAKLATSISAATLLLTLPANAAQAPTLLEKGSSYQQELQDLIDKRGSLPSLGSPSQPSEQKPSSKESSSFRLPDVAKTTLETPKELADKAIPNALDQLPAPPKPTPDAGTPGQPKAGGPSLPKPDLPKPKLEAPKVDLPKPPQLAPTPSSVPTPKLEPFKSQFSAPQDALPQQPGGGLPTPYLVAGGIAVAGIIGIGLAGARPDKQRPAASATGGSSGSSGSAPKSSSSAKSSAGSKGTGGLPEGKDPELDSTTAKKKDPFFKQVKKRS